MRKHYLKEIKNLNYKLEKKNYYMKIKKWEIHIIY